MKPEIPLLLVTLFGLLAFGGVLYLSTPACMCPNVETMSLQSITLYSGSIASGPSFATSRLNFTIINYLKVTYIRSITLTGPNLTSPITEWSLNSGTSGLINFTSSTSSGSIQSNPKISETFVFYPITTGGSQAITAGQVYAFVFLLGNGQSVSGNVLAQ